MHCCFKLPPVYRLNWLFYFAVPSLRKLDKYATPLMGTLLLASLFFKLILLLAIPSGCVKLLGFYIGWAGLGAYALTITMIKGCTKKILYNGSLICAYTIGNFCGPSRMMEEQAPWYLGGIGGYFGGYVLAFLCFIAMRFLMARQNRKRLATTRTGDSADAYQDLSDRKDQNFIYLL